MKNRHWQRFPEMERFPDDAARKQAWEKAYSQTLKRPLNWVAAISMGVGLGLSLAFAKKMGLFASLDRFTGGFGSSMIPGACGGLFGGLAFWLFRGSVTQRLRGELNRTGIPTCMKCGYDLRGCIDQRCSECGQQF
jgi:hypothetical protein